MFGMIAKYAINKMTQEWSESRRELESQLSPPVLRVTLNEMIDEIQAAISRVDEKHNSLSEVTEAYKTKRRAGTDFNFSYNSVIWGVLYSWNQTGRPECRVYLYETFELFLKYCDASKIEALRAQAGASQAYKQR